MRLLLWRSLHGITLIEEVASSSRLLFLFMVIWLMNEIKLVTIDFFTNIYCYIRDKVQKELTKL